MINRNEKLRGNIALLININTSLRQMLQQTQSLRGTDGRQGEDLRRNVQNVQNENMNLKQQVQELSNQLQQSQQQLQQQSFQPGTANQQQEIMRLNNERLIQNSQYEMLRQQFEQKSKDYEYLKVRLQAIDFIQNLPQGSESNKILVQGKEIQRLNMQLIQRDQELEGLRYKLDDQMLIMQQNQALSVQIREYEDKILILSREIEHMLTQVGGLRHDILLKQELDRVKQLLSERERECREWRDKYTKLESDSKNLGEFERKMHDLENRLIRSNEENERLELENRGIQLKLQAFDRLLKEKENLERKVQELESQNEEFQKGINEKRRENEKLRTQMVEREQDLINFKENIFRPCEERQKRLELDIENWRNKCLALENNFFGNNERMYIENEYRRLYGQIQALQQENDELRVKVRSNRGGSNAQQFGQSDNANEERTKLLYAERERLFGEIEQLRKKNIKLEQELGVVKSQAIGPGQMGQTHHIQIIQEGSGVQSSDKDRQLEELRIGIEQLIDENKMLKQEIDNMQMQIEQLEIDNSYLKQRAMLKPKDQNLTSLDIISKGPEQFDVQKRTLEELAVRLHEDMKRKDQEIQELKRALNSNQSQIFQQLQEKDQKINDLQSQMKLVANPQQQLSNSRTTAPIDKIMDDHAQLKRRVDSLQEKQDQKFLSILEEKDRQIELMRRKYQEIQQGQGDRVYAQDLKRIKDMLEMKSYEVEEWKDKFMMLQKQMRNKDNQQYEKPQGMAVLEAEYRKVRQMHDLKSLENEELRQKLSKSPQLMDAPVSDADARKLRMLLEMRTAECEEWRQKCLRLHEAHKSATGFVSDDGELRKHKVLLDSKAKECEDWKYKYAQIAKNKDNSSAIDDLQHEITKHKRMHDLKSIELQEMQPKLQKMQDISKERDVLEKELRRVKGALEQQVKDNETLKAKVISMNQMAGQLSQHQTMLQDKSGDKNAMAMKIQMLTQQLSQAQSQLQDKHTENQNLKQAHQVRTDQVKSIAMNADGKDQQARQLYDENQKLKLNLDMKAKENDDLKNHHQKLTLALQIHQKEAADAKKSSSSQEGLKAQMLLIQGKLVDSDKKVQALQAELQKVANVLKDKQVENEKLKGLNIHILSLQIASLQKLGNYQNEKTQIVQQMGQLKNALEAKSKENDQLKQQQAALAKKIQELQQIEMLSKQHHDRLVGLASDFKGGIQKK